MLRQIGRARVACALRLAAQFYCSRESTSCFFLLSSGNADHRPASTRFRQRRRLRGRDEVWCDGGVQPLLQQ